MIRYFSLIFVFICLFLNVASFAQQTSFTGMLVDEHNEPVMGAHVRLTANGKSMELMSDADGIFHVSQLVAGNYIADLNANGRVVRNKKILVQPMRNTKFYYNFKLFAKGVVVTIMPQDRLIASKYPTN